MPRNILIPLFLLPLVGCGATAVPVTGIVQLDGKAVEGATIVFATEDGKYTAIGQSDATGRFELSTQNKVGAFPGTYKVTVVKTPAIKGGESMTPGSPEYVKQMEKEMKADAKSGMPKMMTPGPGMMMPKGPPTGGGAGSGPIASTLPMQYATPDKTPLTVKVPADGPITLDLKSKP
jgi:hypothetical protein